MRFGTPARWQRTRLLMRLALAVLVTSIAAAGCGHRPAYLVSVYDGPLAADDAARHQYQAALGAAAREAGGSVAVADLQSERQLPNPAAPGGLDAFPIGYVTVLRFESHRAAKRFSKGEALAALDAKAATSLDVVARFSATPFRPLPSMPDAPVVCETPTAPAPAFILLDGITMKKNPLAPMRMLRYMKRNLPRLEAAGVAMHATLKTKKVYRGRFDFDMLFMTQWPSGSVFDSFHADAGFRADAEAYRNPSFRRFAEARGHVIRCSE